MNLSAEEKWIKLRVDGGNELLSTNVRYWGAGLTGLLVGIVQSTRMTQSGLCRQPTIQCF
jgi:hypothetical protein